MRALDRPYRLSKCSRFAKNLIADRSKLFLFVELDMESTNKRAERAIGPAVIARKISGGSRSESSAHTYEVLTSIVQPMRLRGLNMLTDGLGILRTSLG